MGDAADQYTEDGITNLAAHQNGECDYGCEYCAEEERMERRRLREERKRRGSRQRSPKKLEHREDV